MFLGKSPEGPSLQEKVERRCQLLSEQAFTSLTCLRRRSIISRFAGGVPERSKGTDCKSVGSAFEGSNPSPSTRSIYRKCAGCKVSWAGRQEVGVGCLGQGGCSSMVEQKPSKLMTRVRFPSPAPSLYVCCCIDCDISGPCSSVVEHSLGKGEATCSIHVMGTTNFIGTRYGGNFFVFDFGVDDHGKSQI